MGGCEEQGYKDGEKGESCMCCWILEVTVWVMVCRSVEGDSPPAWHSDWEGSLLGFSILETQCDKRTDDIWCCLYQSRPNNICSSELVDSLLWGISVRSCSHGDDVEDLHLTGATRKETERILSRVWDCVSNVRFMPHEWFTGVVQSIRASVWKPSEKQSHSTVCLSV